MATPDRVGFAGGGQAFDSECTRRFEQPVAGRGAVEHLHQRLVDQRAEVVEHGPSVDDIAGGDLLRGRQREAAGERTEAAEDGLLVGRQQPVAPLERGAQCLLPCRRIAAAGGQQAEALVEARAHAFDAEQRHPRRGQLERQRNAVEFAADLDCGGGCRFGQGECRQQRPDARGKQGHRAVFRRLLRRCLRGYCQRRQPRDLFAGDVQRLLAGHQPAQPRRAGERRGDAGACVAEQVLAVVEHEQRVERGE